MTKKKTEKTEAFYMVYVEGRTAPTVKYPNITEAIEEANRLAIKEGRVAYVLKSAARILLTPNVEVIK
jgi:hypothetical protein